MKKKFIYIAALAATLNLTSCDDFLTKVPLDAPTTAQFFNNQLELDGAVTAAYRSIYWNVGNTAYQSYFDLWTDIAIQRAPEIGEGNIDVYNGHAATIWSMAYTTIQRSNTILAGMSAGKNSIQPDVYAQREAEARVLRAYAYSYLIELYGDVPLITQPVAAADYYTLGRNPKAEVLKFVQDELTTAGAVLPWRQNANNRGRVSRTFAYGIKARLALYNKDYQTAATTAKEIIDNGSFSLAPVFADLFTRAGQSSAATQNEMIFEVLYSDEDANNINWIPLGSVSRTAGGQSGRFPQQRLVDMFEAADGKRIDESAVYDHHNPSRNRDIRLKSTVVIPGDTVSMNNLTFVYDIYKPTTFALDAASGKWIERTNNDFDNAFGPAKSGIGLLHGKYTQTNENSFQSRVSFNLMRYAEILLTYAEAKIELGQVDDSVISAINLLRKRAGLPDVTAQVAADQNKMRQLIRRERNAELAMEGFRWFDIRRWGIAQIVMPQQVVGISKSLDKIATMPTFKKSEAHDLNSIPNYDNSMEDRLLREQRFWFDRLLLLPVPQSQRDLAPNLTQNPGW